MINKIYNKNAVKRFTAFFSPTGSDNQVAKLADLNQVVDEINSNFGQVNHTILISQSGTGAPTFKFMATGDAAECKNNCTGDGCPCDCPKECLNSGGASTSLKFAYVSPGVYTLTASFLGTIYQNGIYGVALFATPGINAGDIINVSPSANSNKTVYTFTIKTTAGASLANGVLDGIFFNIQVYTR